MPRRIVFTNDMCTGEPRIDGTRLTCENVVFALGVEQFPVLRYLEAHNQLTIEDIEVCCLYCSKRQCLVDKPINFCDGCVLDKRSDIKPTHFIDSISGLKDADVNNSGDYYLGSEENYDEEKPLEMWKIAKELLEGSVGNLIRKDNDV